MPVKSAVIEAYRANAGLSVIFQSNIPAKAIAKQIRSDLAQPPIPYLILKINISIDWSVDTPANK